MAGKKLQRLHAQNEKSHSGTPQDSGRGSDNGDPGGHAAPQWELYNEHKAQAWQDIQSSTDSFDQNMLTLSSAALGLSLAFIKDIVPLEKAVWLWLLFTSWISFSGCILTTVASFQVSIAAQNKYLEYLWHYYIRRDDAYFNRQKESGPSKALMWMTWLAAAFFIVGLASTLIFCSQNVARRSKMTDSKSVPLVEGRAPVSMTPAPAPDQRGRQPAGMTPVPSQSRPATPPPQAKPSGDSQKK